MKFEKKLIILSGEKNAKGTVTLECNAYGTFATFNIYNLPDLINGEYAAAFKTNEQIYIRNIGSMGRVLVRFKIDELDLSQIHCIIFDTVLQEPVLYGVYGAKKLWEGNMMDGIRSKKVAKAQENSPSDKTAFKEYSNRQKEIDNFFLDIMPKDDPLYKDNAIAQVNYYPSELNIEVAYSARESKDGKDFQSENPIDRALNEKMPETAGISATKDSEEKIDEIKLSLSDIISEAKSLEEKINEKNREFQSAKTNIEETEKEAAPRLALRKEQPKTAEKEFSAGAKIQSAEKSEAASTIPPLSSYSVENAVNALKIEAMFYDKVKLQLDSLFGANPRFDVLEKKMPDTKWVKVDYDNNGKYYVVGLIGSKPDFLCYGVPAVYTRVAPSELSGYCQWLPLNEENPEGDGFWLMFQDALSGESIKQ